MKQTDRLVELFHRRWSVPLLEALDRSDGAKFVTLSNRLGCSQTAVRETLDHLIQLKLVVPNPGYGHPLRPEYLLTQRGRKIAPACARLHRRIDRLGLSSIALKKWSMPVLYVAADGWERFTDIRAQLQRITDRALTLTLKDLVGANLIGRTVQSSFPPIPAYRVLPKARDLIAPLGLLTG